jgi:hypothetical protein
MTIHRRKSGEADGIHSFILLVGGGSFSVQLIDERRSPKRTREPLFVHGRAIVLTSSSDLFPDSLVTEFALADELGVRSSSMGKFLIKRSTISIIAPALRVTKF